MEARGKAFIVSVVLIVPVALLIRLIADGALIDILTLAVYGTGCALVGYGFSPDARPPKPPPVRSTAMVALIPAAALTLTWMAHLTASHALPYFDSEYLLAMAFV